MNYTINTNEAITRSTQLKQIFLRNYGTPIFNISTVATADPGLHVVSPHMNAVINPVVD